MTVVEGLYICYNIGENSGKRVRRVEGGIPEHMELYYEKKK